MKDFILSETMNMTDYQEKIDRMTSNQLNEEKEKLQSKMNVSYLSLQSNHSFVVANVNISDCPDEKNRIYTRMKVKRVIKFISGLLSAYVQNFSDYWDWINKRFMGSTRVPDYAFAKLEGKRVAFADKLSTKGLVAYKRYLLLLYINMAEKNMDLESAAFVALTEEQQVDNDFDRTKFYDSDFLPAGIETIYKNLLKEKMINEKINIKKNVLEAHNEKEN